VQTGGGTPCTTTNNSLQFDNSGSFGCTTNFTYSAGSIISGASGILDLSAETNQQTPVFPKIGNATPTAEGVLQFDTVALQFVGGDGTTTCGLGKHQINNQTGAAGYTANTNDCTKLIVVSNASPQTFNLPSTAQSRGWCVEVENVGTSLWTVSPNGLNLNGSAITLPLSGTTGMKICSDGTGYWAQNGGSSGANTSLSNLTGVAVNAALLPGTTNSIALGSSSFVWSNTFTKLLTTGTAPTITTPGTGWYLFGTPGTEPSSIAATTNGFVSDSTSNCMIVWANAANVGCAAAASNTETFTNKTIAGGSNTLSAIALSSLASESANTVVGALTATTPSALAMPSCSGASSALIWTSGTGFGCNTISVGSTSLDQITGAAAQATGTETAAGHNYTFAGVETANLTSYISITDANSTNNDTNVGLMAGVTGSSTGGIGELVYDVSGTGDIQRWYSGGSVSNGTYTAGTLEGHLSAAGNFTAAGTLTSGVNGTAGGGLTLNGSTSGSAAITVSSAGVLALPSGATATSMALTTPALGTPTSGTLTNATGYLENELTGASAAGTITEGGSTFSVTRAGVSTSNLTAPWVFQNTNSTNNNTSITMGVTAPGTSTGQTVLNVNGATTGGDLLDIGTGGTWTAGVLSGQTIVDAFTPTGVLKFNTAPTVTTPGTGFYAFGTEGGEPASIASGTSGFVMDSTSHCPIVWENATNVGCPATLQGKTTAGLKVPIILAVLDQTGVSTANSGSAQNILASTPVAGHYRVHVYVDQSAGCATLGSGALTVITGWTDATHARVSATQTLTVATADTGTGDWVQIVQDLWSANASAITVTDTYTACTTGTWTYDQHAYVEELE